MFKIIGGLVCHQKPDRTLWIGGHYLPVCARDTGAYIGLCFGYTALLFLRNKKAQGPPNLFMTLAMTIPLFIDSFGQLFQFWTSTNELRLITGLLFGTALAPFLTYALSLFFLKGKIPLLKKIQPDNTALDSKDSWFDAKSLFLCVILSMLIFFGINLLVNNEFYLFYWILSIPIILEIIWHFFILPPITLIITIKYYKRQKQI